MKSTANITIDFPPQATKNYGAEFGFVKYVAPNLSLFVSLFPLKYYTAADNFFPHTVAGSNSVLELGNPNTELGKSALNGGNSIVTGGNPNMELGNPGSNGGKSAPHKNKEKL